MIKPYFLIPYYVNTFMDGNIYETEYPGTVILEGDSSNHELTLDDNKDRVLITETDTNVDQLQDIFKKEGFNQTSIEFKKPNQIGDGFLKNLSDDWDIHVRFIELHKGLVAIDGEVETSRKWLEHNTKDNWISIIYEITTILKKYDVKFSIWHKKMEKYIANVVEQMKIQMTPLGKIEWKHVAIGAGIAAGIGILLWGLDKYFGSKDK